MARPDPLLSEIAQLLDAPAGCDDPAQIERTLTDGYARALTLEAEKSRLEREVGEMNASGSEAGTRLAELTRRIEAKDGSLAHLRALLARLRKRHSVAASLAAKPS